MKSLVCEQFKDLTDGDGVAEKPIQSCSVRRGLCWENFPYAPLRARQVQRKAFNYLASKWFFVLDMAYALSWNIKPSDKWDCMLGRNTRSIHIDDRRSSHSSRIAAQIAKPSLFWSCYIQVISHVSCKLNEWTIDKVPIYYLFELKVEIENCIIKK